MSGDHDDGVEAGRRRFLGGIASTVLASASTRAAAAVPSPSPDMSEPSAWRTIGDDILLERIGFGSCLDQRLPMPIWNAIVDAGPALFVMMGDNVYGDVSSGQMTELRAAYVLLAGNPDFARARAAIPFLATWDDHDYGANDHGADFPHRAAAERIFRTFWSVGTPAPSRDGVYSSRIIGPPGRRVQIILLDLRSFRSQLVTRPVAERLLNPSGGKFVPDPDPSKTMLGNAQWQWLEDELRKPADLRVIVSSIQVLAETHGWERWGHLPAERERLFAAIRGSGARGVLLLSGDRHRAGLYRRSEGMPYLLAEATSSSLNRPFPASEPDDATRMGDMYGGANFGLVAIDWSERRVALTLRNQLGIEVERLETAFSDIGL